MLRPNRTRCTGTLFLAAVVALGGCGGADDPVAPNEGVVVTETGGTGSTPDPFRTSSTEILVPDGDLTQYVGWPAYPGDPAEAWSKIDEGVANVDYSDIIYAMDNGLVERLTFTDLTDTDVVATKLEFTLPIHIGLDDALSAGLTLRYYIDDNEEGSDTYQCGEIPGISCGASTWVVTFDNVCYTDDELATLEVELESVGTWWSPQMTQVIVYALDCEVTYDDALSISGVTRSFDGMNCEMKVTWNTNVASSSKVYWGYSPTTLTNVATGAGNTTSHTVTWDATGIAYNKRVYSKVESATGCETLQSSSGFAVRNYCISQ